MDVALTPLPGRTPGRTSYADDTVDKALALLALNGGNMALTVREMNSYGAENDIEEFQRLSKDTLRAWRDTYTERYRWHQTENAGAIEKRLVEAQREVALIAADGVRTAVEIEMERLESGQVKDAGASARNLATVMGISTTKVLELTGRPTSIVEHRRPEDVVRRMRSIIDSTAEEDENADLVVRT